MLKSLHKTLNPVTNLEYFVTEMNYFHILQTIIKMV